MMEKYIVKVPVDVTSAIAKGTILEYDAANDRYAALASGVPAGVLMEDVAQGQNPAYAKVLFHGIVYEDELASQPDEDTKASLRKVGIYVEARASA